MLISMPPKALMVGLLLLGGLTGCAETLDTHGQVILPSALAQIQPNVTTKQEVTRLLGTPSAVGTLNGERWYYVNSVVGQKAFKPHDLKSRRVVVLDFDPSSSVVLKMTERTEADGMAVTPDAEATRTHGQSMGFLEQMMGNVGLRD